VVPAADHGLTGAAARAAIESDTDADRAGLDRVISVLAAGDSTGTEPRQRSWLQDTEAQPSHQVRVKWSRLSESNRRPIHYETATAGYRPVLGLLC
jgi:hypothetical protein